MLFEVEGFYFYSWRLKVLAFKEVEGFYFCFWMLKVFVHIFGCRRFLLLFLDVIGYCIYSWMFCCNPILRKCEDETHTPEMGTWESIRTPEISEYNCRGQNISHWGVLYIIGKLSKCICRKWLVWIICIFVAQVMEKRKAGSQTGNLIPDH